jgi:Tfp pilus assembly protein PilP
MKKKIYLLLLLLLLVGCEQVVDGRYEVDGRKESSKTVSPMDEIYTVEIEGHKYVIYDGYYQGGIVHAESCQCKERNENK